MPKQFICLECQRNGVVFVGNAVPVYQHLMADHTRIWPWWRRTAHWLGWGKPLLGKVGEDA